MVRERFRGSHVLWSASPVSAGSANAMTPARTSVKSRGTPSSSWLRRHTTQGSGKVAYAVCSGAGALGVAGMTAATRSCAASGLPDCKATQIKQRISAASARMSALATAERWSGGSYLSSVVLEALPGDIVRVAEADQRRAERITLDSAGLDAGRRQIVGQPLQFGARDA
jgi:hypothetical protein